MLDETQVINQDIHGFDEFLNSQCLASLLVIIKEAVANKEVKLSD